MLFYLFIFCCCWAKSLFDLSWGSCRWINSRRRLFHNERVAFSYVPARFIKKWDRGPTSLVFHWCSSNSTRGHRNAPWKLPCHPCFVSFRFVSSFTWSVDFLQKVYESWKRSKHRISYPATVYCRRVLFLMNAFLGRLFFFYCRVWSCARTKSGASTRRCASTRTCIMSTCRTISRSHLFFSLITYSLSWRD